jgi:anti-sigma factor RsiW
VSCNPELVTGYVDGALDAEEAARVAAHLQECTRCRDQAEAERLLRARLRQLPSPEPCAGFESALRAKLNARRIPRLRVLLPLAAALAMCALWLRGSPAVVARALVFDHRKCFRHEQVPAKIFSGDPLEISGWFSNQGTSLPALPARVAGLVLQGARYCPLLDGSSVAHVYYRDGQRGASVYVIQRELRMQTAFDANALGRTVRLLSRGEQTLGVVADTPSDVETLAATLVPRAASVRNLEDGAHR